MSRKGSRSNVLQVLGLTFMLVILLSPFVLAQEDLAAANAVAINTMWTLIAAFLVFFMQAGFAMVEAGFTRAKNAGNIIMKNMMDFAAGSLVYWAVGFAFMFGAGNAFIGSSGFFLQGTFENLGLDIPVMAFFIFQTVFAATAATIVSGAMAERTNFSGYLAYSVVITAFIYPVVGHWIWGGGWLAEMGIIDFAGSTVVHSVGGWAALAGAIVLGPRIGKYNKDGSANALPGHNLLMASLGVFILWFGWFGFNPGSTIAGTDLSIASIAVTTNLAAAAGAVLAMTVSWIKYGKADVSMTLNGALAGLVGITAGTADVSNLSAVIIGAIAGIIVIYSVEFFDKIQVDDPVGAISVHGVCGAFGTLAVGVFALDGGLLYGGGISLLTTQLIGVTAVFFWAFGLGFVLFKAIDLVIGLRVSEKDEIEGLDFSEHGAESYPDFVPNLNPQKGEV
ncbi:ammonium transporter [Halanaerobium sp. Z-7514]|uniref:Ammonium transporter n=1 Tax=Halanaerobium polyolivorans TaxID=2886943 RepID=A0AAW4X002_9FIRM|nr:ammonium transporter [Halanaerobium polyolivorans]MCC3144241.1 ammonium transporter [Halanaerobium polyolivorans]